MLAMLDQLAQPAIIAVFGFIAWFLKGLGASVQELNEQMAVYVERVTMILEHLEDHEARIRKLERDTQSLN